MSNIRRCRLERQKAFELLREYTKSDNLIRHALAVEAAMRAYARRFGEDEDTWGIVGLIHDFDYEQNPTLDKHAVVGSAILRERNYPEAVVHAVLSHNDACGVPRESLLEKTLYAVDELAGFIIAVALVRPSRSLDDLKARSVKKKMKDKGFAAAVDREQLRCSAEELGVDFTGHVDFVIQAMRPVQEEIGLRKMEQ